MSSPRCDRCGSAVPRGGVLCPICHAFVDGHFDGPTRDDDRLPQANSDALDEALNGPTAASPLPSPTLTSMAGEQAFDPPTERIKNVRRNDALASFEEPTVAIVARRPAAPRPVELPPVDPEPPTLERPRPSLSTSPSSSSLFHEPPPTDPITPQDPFAPRLTAPIHHNGILRSATDAVILGDAGDIAGSLLIEQPSADVDDDFLTSSTGAGHRLLVPVQVYIGRDIAEALTPEVVLRIKDGVDVNWVPLSPFERHVVREIDGTRPIARLQARLQLPGDELKLALALLLDKGVVAPVGVALKSKNKAAVGPAHDPDETMQVPPRLVTPAPLRPPAPPPALDRGDVGDDDHTAPAPAASSPVRGARSLLASMFDEHPVAAPGPAREASSLAMQRTRVAKGDRLQAARLHAGSVQASAEGDAARAWQLAVLATAADPDHPRSKDALERWSDAVAAAPMALDARCYAQAVRKESLGDVQGALGLLRQAVVANDRNAAAWNRLGLMLIAVEKDLDAAALAFERAVALSPDDVSFRNNLGKVVDAAAQRGLAGVLRRFGRGRADG